MRRVSVPLKLPAATTLAACAFLIALGLACGFAYGNPQSGDGEAAGIGSGRDGECYTTCIQGGDVWAWGGEYAAGIGGGDAVGVSTGGTTHDLWIHGGTVHAR